MTAVVRAPIAVALDAPDLDTLRRWSSLVAPWVSTVKIGLEAFLRDGAAAVRGAREQTEAAGAGCEVFLDLKLHDIPATVAGAARSVAPLRPDYLTVHASGGPAMVEAAAVALPETRIVAVTVLTSLSADDLERLKVLSPGGSVEDLVVTWAVTAVAAGARAIVCSPQEVAMVRGAVPDDVVLITPGIRPAGAGADDQQRIATVSSALMAGADLLVIGRPITGAADPGAAARALAVECAEAREA